MCVSCSSTYHQVCSGLQRGTHRRYSETGQWVCGPCTGARRQARPPPNPGLTRVGDRKATLPRRERLFVLHWNANGILSSFNELAHFLKKNHVDICMVQETRLLPRDSLPHLPGYVAIRRDRPAGLPRAAGRGGGLLTLVKDDLPFCEVGAFREGMEAGNLEALAVEIRAVGGERFTFVNVYSPGGRGHPASCHPR